MEIIEEDGIVVRDFGFSVDKGVGYLQKHAMKLGEELETFADKRRKVLFFGGRCVVLRIGGIAESGHDVLVELVERIGHAGKG